MRYLVNHFAGIYGIPAERDKLAIANERAFEPDERPPGLYGRIAGRYASMGGRLCILGNDNQHKLVFLCNDKWERFEDLILDHRKTDEVSRQLLVRGPRIGQLSIAYEIVNIHAFHLSWPVGDEDRDFGLWLLNVWRDPERIEGCHKWAPAELTPDH